MAGSTFSVFKTLIVPAVVSLVLFLVLSYVLVPIWRRYRERYSQYLPLDGLSDHTQSIRHRITSRLPNFNLSYGWRWRPREVVRAGEDGRPSSSSEDGMSGEELDEVDVALWNRVEGRDHHSSRSDNTSRLSRDLEEGFRDSSSDDSDS